MKYFPSSSQKVSKIPIPSPTIYVALDIETTGFDTELDHVIEVAALKFQGENIIDRYSTLVNPHRPVPAMVTHITGLQDSDLTYAPSFDDIIEPLSRFLHNHPIVGHNISFDVSFLNAKGLQLKNPLYDTVQLASILLPGLPSYSLDTLGRILKINHEQKHRAMSDTEACHQLFLMLEKKIELIDTSTWDVMKKVLLKSQWPLRGLFLHTADRIMASRTHHEISFEKKLQEQEENSLSLSETPRDHQSDIDEYVKITTPDYFYDKKGPLAQVLDDYEERGGQKTFSEKILFTFGKGGHLLAEAGTGIGKTMAYLLAAYRWSLQHSARVIISTHTRHLQEQILKKEIPLLEKALVKGNNKETFSGLRVTLLKGRKHYLSLQRLLLFLERPFFEDHEVSVLLKVLLWLKETKDGDLEELSLQNKEFTALEEICCAEYVCPHDVREFSDRCFLQKARQRAENSDIVIVNHSLLLQELLNNNGTIPPADYIIIDEAHQLERVSTEAMSVTLSTNILSKPFEKMVGKLEEITAKRQAPDSLQQRKDLLQLLRLFLPRVEILFGLFGILFTKNLEPQRQNYQLYLQHSYGTSFEWQKIREAVEHLKASGLEIIGKLKTLLQEVEAHVDNSNELKNYLAAAEQKIQELTLVLQWENDTNFMAWLSQNIDGVMILKIAPLNVSVALQTCLFDVKKSVILTSATLRAHNSFEYIRQELGLLERTDELSLPSHFNYPELVKIIIPEDFPEPSSEGYFIASCHLINKVIKKNGGRTLTLFTSKKALSATFQSIAPSLKKEGFSVLAQGITGGRGKIIEHFKDEPETSALFGTMSFWEGIDLKGGDLTCVIMQKLPFDPPDDPIIQGRSQLYKDPFNDFQLPRAILKFKQGFGRLIRSATDTGTIIILDSRLVHKQYGQSFLDSLPEGISVEHPSMQEF